MKKTKVVDEMLENITISNNSRILQSILVVNISYRNIILNNKK